MGIQQAEEDTRVNSKHHKYFRHHKYFSSTEYDRDTSAEQQQHHKDLLQQRVEPRHLRKISPVRGRRVWRRRATPRACTRANAWRRPRNETRVREKRRSRARDRRRTDPGLRPRRLEELCLLELSCQRSRRILYIYICMFPTQDNFGTSQTPYYDRYYLVYQVQHLKLSPTATRYFTIIVDQGISSLWTCPCSQRWLYAARCELYPGAINNSCVRTSCFTRNRSRKSKSRHVKSPWARSSAPFNFI